MAYHVFFIQASQLVKWDAQGLETENIVKCQGYYRQYRAQLNLLHSLTLLGMT